MKELLQAPTEGYGEAIVILEILAENFEIKTNFIQLVQANKFHGFERDNPHTHISNFKRMTATLKYRDVLNNAIKLMLFPYSLEGDARVWYEKEHPNSILTWDDLVNQFFPPSKTTHLKNKISRFTQRFEETFGEAWDRFKEMLRACPHHGFSELTQIDTFYNGLTEQDHDSLNAAAGGNLLNKTTREALKIIENKSKVWYSRNKSNVARVNTNSRDNANKTDDRIDKLAGQISNLVEIVNKQVIAPAKAVEKTCVTWELLPEKLGDPGKFLIPCDFPGMEEFYFPTDFIVVDFKADPRVPLILGRSFLRTGRALIDVYGEEITLMVNDESITFNLNQTMIYSSTYDDTLVNRVDVIDIACEEFVQDVLDFQYNPKSSIPTLVSDDLVSESDASKEPIVKSSSPTLTPFGESDFFLEEVEDFLNDDSISTGIENFKYDPEGDILFLEKLLNEDPFQLPLMDLKLPEESKEKSF
uniref:Reverse transcriptase domain-containing protein n=1 Tax=Tanacetum cinerariifolium TaxID=118510 RepID=A0A6L2JDQ2_TANCI|nr:reverse transcriptase domain-containing protein [Tanacetum cinerariifolium]